MCLCFLVVAAPIGVCYGRVANNLPPPSSAVNILKSNKITRARVFDTDPNVLKAFSGTGIELMIDVPNEALPSLASGNSNSAIAYLQSNIFAYVPAKQVRYIAVGNEILLKDPFYTPHVVPAMTNLYQALLKMNLAGTIKLSTPHAASVLSSSSPPSAGAFDPNLRNSMLPLLNFLQDTMSPFMVNVYPYLSYVGDFKYVPVDYALFRSSNAIQDGAYRYTNMFDASIDAFVYAMEKEGFAGIPVLVAETGWPTSGGVGASPGNAWAYNSNVIKKVLGNAGTPKRPGVGVEVYLFDVFDENEKVGDEYERHFGIFGLNGAKAYGLSFN